MSSTLVPVIRDARKALWRLLRILHRTRWWAMASLLAQGDPCYIQRRGDAYVHRFRDCTLVHSSPRPLVPDLWRRRVDEIFLRGWHLANGDVVVELGAGVGTETIELARRVGPNGLVVAVEAHPRTFRLLERCIELNALTNVRLVDMAVSDAAGTVMMSDTDSDVGNAVGDAGLSVRSTTLDAIVAEFAPSPPVFVKVNIEGAEIEALLGGPDTLAKAEVVSVSCHDFKGERTGESRFRTKAAVLRHLSGAGFEIHPRLGTRPPWLRDTVHARRVSS